jgi:hypothetical protein
VLEFLRNLFAGPEGLPDPDDRSGSLEETFRAAQVQYSSELTPRDTHGLSKTLEQRVTSVALGQGIPDLIHFDMPPLPLAQVDLGRGEKAVPFLTAAPSKLFKALPEAQQRVEGGAGATLTKMLRETIG